MRGVLTALLIAALTGAAGGAVPAQADEAHEAYERVVDITFPVAGKAHFSDSYNAPRSSDRVHQASDIMADKLQKVHAAMGGKVTFITGVDSPAPSYGYMLSIRGDDGLEYSYVHMNNDTPGTDDGLGGVDWAYASDVRRGARVERGQWLGYLGDSGNAEDTGAHLHFEIHDLELTNPHGDDRINPHNSLLAALARGDLPGATYPRDGGEAEGPTATPVLSPPTAQPPAVDTGAVARLSGSNRVRTAVALSKERYSSARTVVVVPEGTHAEALVAAPLAARVGGPVLLAPPGGLPDEVVTEVRRLGASNAYLLGADAQLSAAVESGLRDAGVRNLGRLYAADRYELSARVAEDLDSYDSDRFASVILALGDAPEAHRAWPDALSATALAARLGVPILLVTGEHLPEPVRALLAELRPATVTVVGGTAAISDAVAEEAAEEAGGARLQRLAGTTRYQTSVAVAEAGQRAGLDAGMVWVATGRNFPDALAAGPAAAAGGSPLVLIDGATVGGAPESERWLQVGGFDRATVVGGTAAISDPVLAHLRQLLAG